MDSSSLVIGLIVLGLFSVRGVLSLIGTYLHHRQQMKVDAQSRKLSEAEQMPKPVRPVVPTPSKREVVKERFDSSREFHKEPEPRKEVKPPRKRSALDDFRR